ncbi:MAG: hypothetical protein ABI968_04220 [Acidobacteriota bacterium]
MSRRSLLGSLCLAALFAVPVLTAAGPTCNLSGEHLMSWPEPNPVWQFCWLRPSQSSGASGSGLEIRNVYYNGHLLLKRAHVPILNVLYDPGGCGCLRDWSFQEVVFQADNVISDGYAEPTTPPLTVCDVGGSDQLRRIGGDVGTFTGVAAEKLTDRLILTTQFQAGWYRYTMKWRFYLDGRIEPFFGFSAINAACIAFTHQHHAYWRFDFDIEAPDNAVVVEGVKPTLQGDPGVHPPPVTFATEVMRLNNPYDRTWSIFNSATGRGYRLEPGAEAGFPAGSFAVGDAWFLKYKSNELDDSGTGAGCPINIGGFLNGETISSDVVMWYRGGVFHPGGELDHCGIAGPTLYPIGDWSP